MPHHHHRSIHGHKSGHTKHRSAHHSHAHGHHSHHAKHHGHHGHHGKHRGQNALSSLFGSSNNSDDLPPSLSSSYTPGSGPENNEDSIVNPNLPQGELTDDQSIFESKNRYFMLTAAGVVIVGAFVFLR